MSTNPYASPSHGYAGRNINPKSSVRGPAIGLIVVSTICLFVVALALFFSGFLLFSGAAGQLQQPTIGISKETQIAIRMIWSVFILAANIVILMGAVRMQRLESYSSAKLAAILAVIPCVGPCYLLGIPFGIWALVVLSKPEVKEAFR
jgi:hypothetical protein